VSGVQALQIIITGRVQGVGFRPFVSCLANELGLSGWVRNCSGKVEIRVEGVNKALSAFIKALHNQAPPLAQPDYPQVSSVSPSGFTGFTIKQSQGGEKLDSHIPPDYFVCDDCLAEMQDPSQRRYRYPFINCTQCGPRYTLIDRLPYDRPNTTMAEFELCPDCQAEYLNPIDRRYHAQPLACSKCGPSLTFHQPGRQDIVSNNEALSACIDSLREGLVVAVKGVGGYHLFCDASDSAAVNRLRLRKSRPDKPLAVMVPWRGEDGLTLVEKIAELTASEKQLIASPLRPIVLASRKANTLLSQNIAAGLSEVGLMLPYSPLHHLLMNDYASPLVATSANLTGEPVLTNAFDVEQRLGSVADAFLHHNRPIRRPADDSVFRRIAKQMRPIRLGRGLAPIERKLAFQLKKPLLAVGADLKNTVALAFDDRVVISPHVGDLGSLRSAQVFEQLITDLLALYGVSPELIVCDAHPAYHSSRWAKRHDLPIVPVYHHHAHASALAGEHDLDQKMMVFTWDGTGYGEDGTIWGGETLVGSPGHWQRAASFRPFSLLGGEKASREPWRCALSVCWEHGLEWYGCSHDVSLLKHAWQQNINCPRTSSVGRLFDAVAALIGIGQYSSYEGHVAMQMEAISTAGAEAISLPLTENSMGILISDWGPLVPFLMDNKVSVAERSSVFHASLVSAIITQAQAIRKKYNISTVGLSGGVFQNKLLAEQSLFELEQQGFEVYLHKDIPCGDGGISFGQIIEAGSIEKQSKTY